jgi:hypothetical protein
MYILFVQKENTVPHLTIKLNSAVAIVGTWDLKGCTLKVKSQVHISHFPFVLNSSS